MQAAKIELGQTYAADGFDFRATGIITIRRNKSTTSYVEGVKVPVNEDAPEEVKVEVKDIIDTVEARNRLKREAEARDAVIKAEKQAQIDRRAKAVRLLATAIGVTADEKGDYKVKGPKVAARYSGIEVDDDTLDALIRYLENAPALRYLEA